MLIKEHRAILALFDAYQKNAFPVIIVNFCDRDLREHALNYSQNVVSDTNKHFKFESDGKLNP